MKHKAKARMKSGTSRSSSLVGFALSLRESSTAFLKAGVWATIMEIYDGFLLYVICDDCVGGRAKMKRPESGMRTLSKIYANFAGYGKVKDTI